eukprot:11441703-Alexandrium_andersonii.AAC.1
MDRVSNPPNQCPGLDLGASAGERQGAAGLAAVHRPLRATVEKGSQGRPAWPAGGLQGRGGH